MYKIIHHIRNLRSKPVQTRVHLLHVFTIVAGVVLLIAWVYSFGSDIASPSTQAGIQNSFQPFSALKSNLVDGYNSLSNNSGN